MFRLLHRFLDYQIVINVVAAQNLFCRNTQSRFCCVSGAINEFKMNFGAVKYVTSKRRSVHKVVQYESKRWPFWPSVSLLFQQSSHWTLLAKTSPQSQACYVNMATMSLWQNLQMSIWQKCPYSKICVCLYGKRVHMAKFVCVDMANVSIWQNLCVSIWQTCQYGKICTCLYGKRVHMANHTHVIMSVWQI